MSTENLIKVEDLEGGFKLITVNRESALNALNSDVLNELNSCLESFLSSDNCPNGILLTGSGDKAFIAGADIKSMVGLSKEEAKSLSELGQQTTCLMESLNCPVIACVNGYALGGGLEMALGCDFIYASKNAVFGLPEVKLGLIPGFGGTQRLVRVVGRNKAREIVFTGKNIVADEALELGIVNRLFESKEDLINGAIGTLATISKNSIHAVGNAKKAILSGADIGLEESLALEAEVFGSVFEHSDAREGTEAFSEKRKAKFSHHV